MVLSCGTVLTLIQREEHGAAHIDRRIVHREDAQCCDEWFVIRTGLHPSERERSARGPWARSRRAAGPAPIHLRCARPPAGSLRRALFEPRNLQQGRRRGDRDPSRLLPELHGFGDAGCDEAVQESKSCAHRAAARAADHPPWLSPWELARVRVRGVVAHCSTAGESSWRSTCGTRC
jgi:hypothetical protein